MKDIVEDIYANVLVRPTLDEPSLSLVQLAPYKPVLDKPVEYSLELNPKTIYDPQTELAIQTLSVEMLRRTQCNGENLDFICGISPIGVRLARELQQWLPGVALLSAGKFHRNPMDKLGVLAIPGVDKDRSVAIVDGELTEADHYAHMYALFRKSGIGVASHIALLHRGPFYQEIEFILMGAGRVEVITSVDAILQQPDIYNIANKKMLQSAERSLTRHLEELCLA